MASIDEERLAERSPGSYREEKVNNKLVYLLLGIVLVAFLVVSYFIFEESEKIDKNFENKKQQEQQEKILVIEADKLERQMRSQEIEKLTDQNKELIEKLTSNQAEIAESNRIRDALALVGKGRIKVITNPGFVIRLMNSKLVYADLIQQNPNGVPLDVGYYKIGVFQEGYLPGYADVCLSSGETLIVKICSPGKIGKAKKAVTKKIVPAPSPPPVAKKTLILPQSPPTTVIIDSPDAGGVVVPCFDDCPSGEKIILNLPRGN